MAGVDVSAAKDRALVSLPDGRSGRLLYVNRHSHRAKVLIGGRHYRVPVEGMVVVEAAKSDQKTWEDTLRHRPRLTAKALRALGRPVPHNVPDDECVDLIERTTA